MKTINHLKYLVVVLILINIGCSKDEDPSGDCLCTRKVTTFNPNSVVGCSLNYPVDVTQNFNGINESTLQDYNQDFDPYIVINPKNGELIVGEQIINNVLIVDTTKDYDIGKFTFQVRPQELIKDTIIEDFRPESYDEIIRQSSVELTVGGETYTFDEDSEPTLELTLNKNTIEQNNGEVPYMIKVITVLEYIEGEDAPVFPKEISIRTSQLCIAFDPDAPDNVETQEYFGDCADDGNIFIEGESFVRVSCVPTN